MSITNRVIFAGVLAMILLSAFPGTLAPKALANDLVALSDEFAESDSLADWHRRFTTEAPGIDQLARLEVDAVDAPGAMLLEPHTSSWYGPYRGALVYKTVTGDFAFTTHLRVEGESGGLPSSNYSLAGTMIRTPPAAAGVPENYVFLSVGYGDVNHPSQPGPGPHFEVKTTENGNSVLALSPSGTLEVTLQIARLGETVVTLYQRPGEEWAVHRVYERDDFPATLQVGLVAYTDWDKCATYSPGYHNSHVLVPPIPGDPSSNPGLPFNPDVIATYDFARFYRPTVPPGIDPASATAAELLSFLGETAAVAYRPGDVDLDGVVDRRDAALFARSFGMASGAVWTDGDFDGDQAVTLADLAVLQRNLDVVAASAAAVPEPASFWLVISGLAAGCALRRVRRN